METTIHTHISDLAPVIDAIRSAHETAPTRTPKGICGFDGFVDNFIRFEEPASMAELGPKVTAAAGIAASFVVRHEGERFGGNGPLLAAALHELHGGHITIDYIGGIGEPKPAPLFQNALGDKMTLHTLAEAAQTDCLEFTDGKLMLCDIGPCANIHWDRMVERMGLETIDRLLGQADFIAAVNWGKLVNAGSIWRELPRRLKDLGKPAKAVPFFMDLAEFDARPLADREALLELVAEITRQCTTMLSFNLKEAWQMAETLGQDFSGQKTPEAVAAVTAYLWEHTDVDRVIVHPNNGAACASEHGCVFVPGPHCAEPLISTGAGDNFGAGCLAATLKGLDDAAVVLTGNCASGYYVRSGRSATFSAIIDLLQRWQTGNLPERL